LRNKKNPIDMWIDDCVDLAVIEAMALRDIMNEREAETKETFREYYERTRGEKLPVKIQNRFKK
jgi:hypothetical protein